MIVRAIDRTPCLAMISLLWPMLRNAALVVFSLVHGRVCAECEAIVHEKTRYASGRAGLETV